MLAAGILFSALVLIFGGMAITSQPAESRFHAERVELRTGYGYQYKSSTRRDNFQYHPLMASTVLPLSGEIGPSWLRGRVEWSPEVHFGYFTHPYNRPIVGVTPLQVKYTLTPKSRFTPYGLAGSGILYANINRRETGRDLNFNLQLGAGSYVHLTEGADLILEYRHIHISNAGSHEDNAGLNMHTFLAGVSFKK